MDIHLTMNRNRLLASSWQQYAEETLPCDMVSCEMCLAYLPRLIPCRYRYSWFLPYLVPTRCLNFAVLSVGLAWRSLYVYSMSKHKDREIHVKQERAYILIACSIWDIWNIACKLFWGYHHLESKIKPISVLYLPLFNACCVSED